MKEIREFLLSPIPAAVLGGTVSWATGGYPRLVSLIIFYVLLLYAAQLVFGLAISFYLLKIGRRSALNLAVGGVLMVAVPAVPYIAWAVSNRPGALESGLIVLALWLVCGAVTGLTYWYLRHRNQVPSDVH